MIDPTRGRPRHNRVAATPWLALLLVAAAPPASGEVSYVFDGDTFRLTSGERIRIAGIDAPETRKDQARCPLEMVRGRRATRETRALLAGRRVMIERVGRSYGRSVARVTLAGEDLAARLVSLGIARPWPRGARKPDWCRR